MAVKQETIDKYLGKVFDSRNYGKVIVTKYVNAKEVHIKFLNTGYECVEPMSSIVSGYVKDRSLPTTCGVGFIDVEGASIGRNVTKWYAVWNSILGRCYNENLRHKHKTYEGCIVSEDWKYLSNFKKWYDSQIGCDQDGWHIDKDLLIKGNKVYSAETCVLLPPQINSLIVGADAIRGDLPKGVYYDKSKGVNSRYRARVSQDGKYVCYGSYSNLDDAWLAYKEAKEAWIKVVAERWKDKIDPKAYNALLNYTVEWDD